MAAFMFSCDTGSKDVFYDELLWPEGCKLCDWLFYHKKKTDDSSDTKKGDNNRSDTQTMVLNLLTKCIIATFNVFGFRIGVSMLNELCYNNH